jgi:hypothetical protein
LKLTPQRVVWNALATSCPSAFKGQCVLRCKALAHTAPQRRMDAPPPPPPPHNHGGGGRGKDAGASRVDQGQEQGQADTVSVFGGSGDLWSNLFLFLLMLMGLYKVRSRWVTESAASSGGGVDRTCHTRALSLAALPARVHLLRARLTRRRNLQASTQRCTC